MKTYKDEISKELRKPLPIEMVEFRVQSLSAKGYLTLLAYKDARVDLQRLDEVVGVLNWKREHTRDNKNCIVSIWDDKKEQWISKEDTGSESFSEKEKGLASDSFKRACFNFGIGIELYDYPHIFFQLYPNEFKVENNKAKPTFDLNIKKWKWNIEHNDKGILLKGYDDKKRLRYDSTKDFNGIPKGNAPTPTKQPTPTKKPVGKKQITDELYNKAMGSDIITSIETVLDKYEMTDDQMGNLTLRVEGLKQAKK